MALDYKTGQYKWHFQEGQTGSVTFNTAGTFTYNCTPHPWMIGQVIVQ